MGNIKFEKCEKNLPIPYTAIFILVVSSAVLLHDVSAHANDVSARANDVSMGIAVVPIG